MMFLCCALFFSRSIENVKVSNKYIVLDKLFGTHFQTTPTTQSTTNPSITSKTTDRTSTSNAHTPSHATSNKYIKVTAKQRFLGDNVYACSEDVY